MKNFLKYTAIFALIVVIVATTVILIKRKPKESTQTKSNPIVENVLSTAASTTSYNGKINVKINGGNIPVDVKLCISPSVKFDVTLNFTSLGVKNKIRVTYLDNFCYITIDENNKYCFDARKVSDDLPFLKSIITSLTPSNDNLDVIAVSSDSNKTDIFSYMNIDTDNFDLSSIDLSSIKTLLNKASTKKTAAGYEIKLDVANTVNASFEFDKEYNLESFSTDEILFMGNLISISYDSNASKVVNITKPAGTYLDLTNSTNILKIIKNRLDEDAFKINFTLKVSGKNYDGTFISQKGTTYRAYAYTNIANTPFSLRIQGDVWYLDYGKAKYYGTFEDCKLAIKQLFSKSSSSISSTIDSLLKILNGIREIENTGKSNNILLTNGNNIKFFGDDDKVSKIEYSSKNIKFVASFVEYPNALASVNKTGYVSFEAIKTLTNTGTSGNSFLSAFGKLIFSTKPAFNVRLCIDDMVFEGDFCVNFTDSGAILSVDGKLQINKENTTVYTIKITQGANCTYVTFGNTKLRIDNTYLADWSQALTSLINFDAKTTMDALNHSNNISDFAIKLLTKSSVSITGIDEIIDKINKINISGNQSTAKISYTAKNKAKISLVYNLSSDNLSLSVSDLKIGNSNVNLNVKTIAENTLSRTNQDNSKYLNISQLCDVFNSLNKTMSNGVIQFMGPVAVDLPIIGEIAVDVIAQIKLLSNGKLRVAILVDNLPTGAYMNLSVSTTALFEGTTRHYVYIYIDNGKIYFDRCLDYEDREKIGGSLFSPEYRYFIKTKQIESGYLNITDLYSTKDAMGYLTDVFGIGGAITSVAKIFTKKTKTIDVITKLDKAISGYYYSAGRHNITIDTPAITENSDLSKITLTITTSHNKITQFGGLFNVGSFMKMRANNFKVYATLPTLTYSYKHVSEKINMQNILTQMMYKLDYNVVQKTYTKHA